MGKTEPAARIVVCDAGPLIHLHELDCLDLLGDFAQVLVPSAVWEEVKFHRSAVLELPGVALNLTEVGEALPPDLAAVSRFFGLHLGEPQALQLARQVSAELFFTDDTAARLAARSLGMPVHGTLGILVRSIRRGQRTAAQVAATLHSLPTVSTLHIKRSLLEEVIEAVERRK